MDSSSPRSFWRVFPWDSGAAPGEPFSPQFVVPAERQTRGRFDLGPSPVLPGLLRYGIQPDVLASRDRALTQHVSRRLYEAGTAGFRWWSALHGDWHAHLLFLDRVAPGELAYATPEALDISHSAVIAAARELRMAGPREP